MRPLTELDRVPWDRLHHAYGPATDVPALLQALMTPDAADADLVAAAAKNKRSLFDHVTWELWGNVYHQGSVWQVTAHVVPFLATILRNGPDDPNLRAFLISYLHNIAVYYPDSRFPQPFDPKTEFAEVVGQADPGTPPDYSANDLRPVIWMRDSYAAVAHEVETVLPFLGAQEEEVAEEAIAFCASFPRQSDITIPALTALAEGNDRRAALALISLAVLQDARVGKLAPPLMTSGDRQTALLATCAMAISDPTQLSPDDVARLTAPLGDLAKLPSAHAGSLAELVGACNAQLQPAHAKPALDGLCRQLANAGPMESLSLTQNLLELAFADKPPDNARDLTPEQRQAVEAIRDHGAFKVGGGIFANYGNLLSGWGLPSTAKALNKWLGRRSFFGRWF